MADRPWGCWREDVLRALDAPQTSRDYAQTDRAIATATRSVEGLLNRRFYPETATRYFDWPSPNQGTSYRLWLDADELVSVTSITAGGVTLTPAQYYLEPANMGPPFNRVEINLGTSAAFGGGLTRQRNVAIVGVYGYDADTTPAGALASAISTTVATTCTVTDSSLVGVGAILLCESERMIVTGKANVTTAQTGSLTAVNSDQALNVTTGSAYAVGEVLTLDQERVLVLDVTGNTLTVRRAWDGTTLAAHTAATIYAPRTLTVTRAALGSTAAAHSSATALTTAAVPSLVRSLTVAEAVLTLGREQAGYTSTARGKTLGASGDTGSQSAGNVTVTAIDDLRRAAVSAYGRTGRTYAV